MTCWQPSPLSQRAVVLRCVMVLCCLFPSQQRHLPWDILLPNNSTNRDTLKGQGSTPLPGMLPDRARPLSLLNKYGKSQYPGWIQPTQKCTAAVQHQLGKLFQLKLLLDNCSAANTAGDRSPVHACQPTQHGLWLASNTVSGGTCTGIRKR